MFTALKNLLAPHLGLLWERYKPEYSECQEVAPLPTQIEDSGGSLAGVEILDVHVPPLPRIWFTEPNGNRLVQIQRERFHHNWRKINPEDEYPRHKRVLQVFNERLETFRSFVSESGLGELQLKQYEMTYVNHILAESGWNSVADISKVFPDFSWRDRSDRPLGAPEGIHWKSVFALPEGMGRLHVTIRNASRITDNQPILLFELTGAVSARKRRLTICVPGLRWLTIKSFRPSTTWLMLSFRKRIGGENHDSSCSQFRPCEAIQQGPIRNDDGPV